MLAVGFGKYLTGNAYAVQQVADVVHGTQVLTLFLLLRAFASGSTAVTGVEAISNGITAFEEPKSHNAAATMAWMCGLLGVMFLGITKLALAAHAQPSTSETVISQLGRTVFSANSPFYVAVIFGTAAVLVMAANTSFADFPRLAALHAGDGFLPRWLTDRDNRLVFGIGITVLIARRRPADRRLQGQRRRPDPALRDRRLPLVHDLTGRHGRALAEDLEVAAG